MTDSNSISHSISRNDLPIYPKAFIAAARLARESDRVFVAMPFEESHSDDLWSILKSVSTIRGFNFHRADLREYQDQIVRDIMEELEKAEIVIADLTGMKPNILYEVGIAHTRCDAVILICQKGEELPFDLKPYHCLFYDLSTPENRVDFTDRLGKKLSALRSATPPNVIESKEDRTEIIINDLKTISNLPDEQLVRESILFSGGLSVFAIGEQETFEPEEESYHKALLEEKTAMLDLARRGCPIKCIITASTENASGLGRYKGVKERLEYLLEFLQGDDPALEAIDWAISPFRQKNLYIIGHISFLEGFKKGVSRGFQLTLRQTGTNAISANISLFESLFEHLAKDTIDKYKTTGKDRRAALRNAVIKSIKTSLAKF